MSFVVVVITVTVVVVVVFVVVVVAVVVVVSFEASKRDGEFSADALRWLLVKYLTTKYQKFFEAASHSGCAEPTLTSVFANETKRFKMKPIQANMKGLRLSWN